MIPPSVDFRIPPTLQTYLNSTFLTSRLTSQVFCMENGVNTLYLNIPLRIVGTLEREMRKDVQSIMSPLTTINCP